MSNPCKNHYLIAAGKRCFQCKEYICPSCTTHKHGHLFCGSKCIFKFQYHAKSLKLLTPFQRLGFFKVASKKPNKVIYNYDRITLVAVLFVMTFLLVDYFNFKSASDEKISELTSEISKLSTGLNSRKAIPVIENPTNMEGLPKITTKFNEDFDDQVFKLIGNADKGYLILIYLNGKYQKTIEPDSGEFVVDGLSLRYGKNTIVVKVAAPDNKLYTIMNKEINFRTDLFEQNKQNVTRGDTSLRRLALTFDGGSNSSSAKYILDILQKKGITSTFFLTGKFIENYPDLVKSILKGGHEIGNHTYSHLHLTSWEENSRHDTKADVTEKVFKDEMNRTERLFNKLTGQTFAHYWRSPYGEQNPEIRTWAAELGYGHIGWTVENGGQESMDTLDWVIDKDSHLYSTAAEIKEKILNFNINEPEEANGAIVLMHLGSFREDENLYEKLDEIIDGYIERGYKLCTITDLLRTYESDTDIKN